MKTAPFIGSILSFCVVSCATSSAPGQPLKVEASNGTVMLTGGFLPDPHVMKVVPGGATQVADMGAGCAGYIDPDQPDLKLELRSPGDRLGVFVAASADTTLVINGPDGSWFCSDDAEFLSNTNPGVSFTNPTSGIYDIWVGSYESTYRGPAVQLAVTETDTVDWAGLDLGGGIQLAGSDGSVQIDAPQQAVQIDGINFGDDSGDFTNDGECDDPRFRGAGSAATLLEADRLRDATDCSTLFQSGQVQLVESANVDAPAVPVVSGATENSRLEASGEVDHYSYQGNAGDTLVFDLQSTEFDTFLTVVTPSGERLNNDDYNDSQQRSQLTLTLSESGEYRVEVASYDGSGAGAYALALSSVVVVEENSHEGRLESGDGMLGKGEYFDTWTFEGQPGRIAAIELSSTDFDSFLVLEAPDGEIEVNDDADDSDNASRIERLLSVPGTYSVRVTSYTAGETGAYTLRIVQSETSAARE